MKKAEVGDVIIIKKEVLDTCDGALLIGEPLRIVGIHSVGEFPIQIEPVKVPTDRDYSIEYKQDEIEMFITREEKPEYFL